MNSASPWSASVAANIALFRRLAEHLPTIVAIFLVVCLLSDVISRVAESRLISPTVGRSAPLPPPAPSDTRALQTILAAHLFGVDTSANSTAGPPTTASGLTKHLTGTIALEGNPEHGYALFKGPGDAQRLVAVGDEVESERILIGVYSDHVVFNHLGVREFLSIAKSEKAPIKYVAAVVQADPETIQQQVDKVAGAYSRMLRPADSDNHTIFSGVEIADGAASAGLGAYGIHTGDKVMTINGVRISSPDTLAELASGGTVALGIQNESGYHVVHLDAALLR